MGSLPTPELSLDARPAFVPSTIGKFLREVADISDPSRRSSRIEDFVKSLEGEMKKIDAFKRELPISMLLLQDAIVTLKLELVQCTPTSTQPVLAALMPLTKGIDELEKEGYEEKETGAQDKRNWKNCLHLWTSSYSNSSAVQPAQAKSEAEDVPIKSYSSNGVKNFMPLRGFSTEEGNKIIKELPVSSRSIFHNLRSSHQQYSRKQRRCWSPELHRRFLNALQQLGGSQVATPKQIRELMQVDGLTNDEVKSHLQKYRLHTLKPPSASSSPSVFQGLGLSSQTKTDNSSKGKDSSGSPEGPLQLCTTGSAGAGESMEDEEDTKSERYRWKNKIHRQQK